MAGEQSLDAPAGSSRLNGSVGGHGRTPLSRTRLVSPAVLYNATNVAIIGCQAHPLNELFIASFFANFSELHLAELRRTLPRRSSR